MKAEELIKEHIAQPFQSKARVIAFCNNGKDWYHVHKAEEVPGGHIQIRIAGCWKVDLYHAGEDNS